MSIVNDLIGLAKEMLMVRDDHHSDYAPPRVVSETRDACGDVISQTVRADNYRDATRHLNGVTISGNRHIVATRTSARTWIIHIENWK